MIDCMSCIGIPSIARLFRGRSVSASRSLLPYVLKSLSFPDPFSPRRTLHVIPSVPVRAVPAENNSSWCDYDLGDVSTLASNAGGNLVCFGILPHRAQAGYRLASLTTLRDILRRFFDVRVGIVVWWRHPVLGW